LAEVTLSLILYSMHSLVLTSFITSMV